MFCKIRVSSCLVLALSSGDALATLSSEKDIDKLQQQVLQFQEKSLQNLDFQKFVSELKGYSDCRTQESLTKKNSQIFPNTLPSNELYIFVSFSLGEKALLNLAQEARQFGATLVLRGFKAGSYKKTAQALQRIIQKTGQGFIIDPELFTLFSVSAVPTYILSQPFSLNSLERTFTPLHDRLQGHVSIRYALETFAKSGDLQEEAKSLLAQTFIERDQSK